MKRTSALVAALILTAAGCHMCSDCCDYSSPVANSPYAGTGGRAGSNSSGMNGPVASPEPYYDPDVAIEPENVPVTEPQTDFAP
jgi:hypothetical protein